MRLRSIALAVSADSAWRVTDAKGTLARIDPKTAVFSM
jgi:hypothetical protein